MLDIVTTKEDKQTIVTTKEDKQTLQYNTKITLILPTVRPCSTVTFICFAPTVEYALEQAIEFCKNKTNHIILDKSVIEYNKEHSSLGQFIVSVEQVLIT